MNPSFVAGEVAQFATAKTGLILVDINPAYWLSELEYCVKKLRCRALISAERLESSDYLAMLRTLAPELDVCAPGKLVSARLPQLTCLIRQGTEVRHARAHDERAGVVRRRNGLADERA